MSRTRTAATLSAALLLGAGGGAGTALLIHDDGGATVTRVATAEAPATAAVAGASGDSTVSAVYQRAKQGVVDIKVKTADGTAEGSGFVIDSDGDIVTNQHVVDGAQSLAVKFADGTDAGAKVVGSDASSDLAVIRVSGVDASVLQPLTLGDSSKVKVGDEVVTIGSPYGLEGSVTAGIVSALGRSISAPDDFTIAGAIQTDAPINHGNSGGPLLDSSGDVVGVNAQIESDTGENTGVGFAIPSNTVKSVAEQIVAGGQVSHPYIGLELTDGEAGATVGAVTGGGPAEAAGLEQGDVITAVDGQAVASSEELVAAVQSHDVGDEVTLTVQRGSGTQAAHVTLGDRAAAS